MSHQVRVLQKSITLPNGKYYETVPTDVTLTDMQFALISPATFTSGTLQDLGYVSDDVTTVHLAGAETITGPKNFTASPTVPAPTLSGHVVNKGYVDAAVLAGGGGSGGGAVTSVNTRVGAVMGLAEDSTVVHNSGTETIAGAKNFTSPPTVPTPTANGHAAGKGYVDTAIANLVNSAPGTLDTLGEIAAQLNSDESAAAALANTVAGKLAKASNLSDLVSPSSARTNLGLGGAAVLNVGTVAGTVADGGDSRITGAIQASIATTKGDLLAATGSAALARMAVGTNGQILTADSTQAAGMKWAAAPASGGFTPRAVSINTTAVVGEMLEVNASGGARTVAAPSSPTAGDRLSIVKVDNSANVVTFTGATNGDASCVFTSQWAGATLIWDGSVWVVWAVNVTTSGPGYSDEQAQDAVAALVAAGTHSGISFVYDDPNNALSATVTGGGYTDEAAQDAVAAMLAAGTHTGITVTYNDAGNSMSLAATGGGGGGSYTDEQAQDAIAALIAAGTHYGISFVYDDPNNTLSATVANPDTLASGEEVVARKEVNSSSLQSQSGYIRLTYHTAKKSFTSTQTRIVTGTVGSSGGTPTLCRIGLFTVNTSTGLLTLVAATVNDTTVLSTASVTYTRPWSSSYGITAGVRYAVGIIYVGSGTPPTLAGFGSGSSFTNEMALSPRLCGTVISQTDLPSIGGTIADASLVASANCYYTAILP